MLWYLLSPIRGTTQPPRLSANHPVRTAFYRHGKTIAQHWLVVMLVSSAIMMAFSYPTVLLSENPTTGFTAFPHHVWTTARSYDGDPANVDVEMRQVWIHGSYMKALDKDVLKNALQIQQTLVGREGSTSILQSLGDRLRSGKLSWGYHSPLMYWNNSEQSIDGDDDILRTINEQARSFSSLNVPMRPASVFAGKKFDRRKLQAADALVITLMNKVGDDMADGWRDRFALLTAGMCKGCTFFPRDGHITRSREYEFSFMPLSLQENILLTFAYSCMAVYVLLCLRRLKAFHSRFGLVVTAITQMTCSILASFTICGILKIDLSMIPQNAYPFVVLVISIENMFRIINAVLAYPATMATDMRIANALGDVGPVSIATAAQNLLILAVLSQVVSPGVAAFCAFACIATLFDVFFLLTFFVAVLNVDIRRFELQDAIVRGNQSKHRRRPSPSHHHTWFDALVQGRLPFSTRMAGTAVTTTFILSLNYHFFEQKEKTTSLTQLLGLIGEGPPKLDKFDTFAPPPINASLTPGQWMRMQDYDTAREVMRLAKPGADAFIIRVFAPLIVVLSGADRTDMDLGEAWSSALRSFATHHFYPVAVAVVFAVAFVAVLMNFLLYTDVDDEPRLEREEADEVQVKSVALPHKLDIVKLSGSSKGSFVTVALDRSIAVSRYDRSQQLYSTSSPSPNVLSRINWPIYKIAIDDAAEWVASSCADGKVLIFNCQGDETGTKQIRYPDEFHCVFFGFVRLSSNDIMKSYFLLITSGGRLATVHVEGGSSKSARLVDVPLLGAAVLELGGLGKRLFVVTEEAEMLSFVWTSEQWTQTSKQTLSIRTAQDKLTGAVHIEQYCEQVPDVVSITTSQGIVFIDSQTLSISGRYSVSAGFAPSSRLMLGPPTNCQSCDQLAFEYAALVSDATGLMAGECTITTLRANSSDAVVCLKNEGPRCHGFEDAHETKHSLSRAGAWTSVTASQVVIGLRRQVFPPISEFQGGNDYGKRRRQPAPPLSSYFSSSRSSASSSRLRRGRHSSRTQLRTERGKTKDDEVVWEAYKFSLDGAMESVDVPPLQAHAGGVMEDANADAGAGAAAPLYVSSPGPVVALDDLSVAVAFGNTVKVIRATRRGSVTRRRTSQCYGGVGN